MFWKKGVLRNFSNFYFEENQRTAVSDICLSTALETFWFNPKFQVNIPFLYLLKTPGNQSFPGVFSRYNILLSEAATRPEVFCKKRCSQKFRKNWQENTCARALFLINDCLWMIGLKWVKVWSRKFYIWRNKNQDDSIETGRRVIAGLLSWSDLTTCMYTTLF